MALYREIRSCNGRIKTTLKPLQKAGQKREHIYFPKEKLGSRRSFWIIAPKFLDKERKSIKNVQCPTGNVQCSIWNIQCPMSNRECPMSNRECPMSDLEYSRKDNIFTINLFQYESNENNKV